MDLKEIGQRAKDASYILGTMDSQRKNEGLRAAASELSGRREEILRANEEDLRLAREKGMAQGLLDRLLLTPERIEGIVTGMVQVMDLEDPIGQVLSMKKRAQRPSDRPEEGASGRCGDHLRGQAQCDGRRLCPVF